MFIEPRRGGFRYQSGIDLPRQDREEYLEILAATRFMEFRFRILPVLT
jgi:hypothetical protein